MNTPYIPADGLISALKRRLTRFSARKPLDCAQGRFLVSFSFDDFPHSAASTGANILQKYGWQGTYYTSASFVNTTNHLGELFSENDIPALMAKGHEIGCHTAHHIDCALNPNVVIEQEIRENQSRLRAMGAAPAVSFAFPYGEASARAKDMLGGHFTSLRGVRQGINRRFADARQLNAVPIEGAIDALELAQSFIDDLRTSPGWLIFYTHDVREQHSEWGCTPALLDAVCKAVQNAGFEVLPVGKTMASLSALKEAA